MCFLVVDRFLGHLAALFFCLCKSQSSQFQEFFSTNKLLQQHRAMMLMLFLPQQGSTRGMAEQGNRSEAAVMLLIGNNFLLF